MRNEYVAGWANAATANANGDWEWGLGLKTVDGRLEGRRAIERNLGGYKNKPAPPHVAWNRTEAAAAAGAGTMANILQCTAIKFGIPRRHTLHSALQLELQLELGGAAITTL